MYIYIYTNIYTYCAYKHSKIHHSFTLVHIIYNKLHILRLIEVRFTVHDNNSVSLALEPIQKQSLIILAMDRPPHLCLMLFFGFKDRF